MIDRDLVNKLILRIWRMEEQTRALSRELDALESDIANAVEDE